MQPAPHAGCGPLAEPAVRGLEGHSERRRKLPPPAPAGQHVHDRGEHRAVLDRRRAADPANGRQVAVTATAAGRRELDRDRQARAAAIAEVLTQWTDSGPAELRRTTAFLERLADAFDTTYPTD